MIHEIGVELNAKLSAKGCPLKVIDGPEATKTTTGARERIVIEHDESAGDSFSPPLTQHKNPKMRMIRNIGVTLTVYAQAVNAGAMDWEHRRRAEHVVDLLMVSLYDTLKFRKNGFQIKKAGFIQTADLEPSEVIAGAVYQISLSIERGVYDTTWVGDKRPELAVPSNLIHSTTNTNLAHAPDTSTPEVSCGA